MSQFDKDLEIGDIVVSTYKSKGYWRVISIEENHAHGRQYSSHIHVELVMNNDGVEPKKKAKKDKFNAGWLIKIDAEYIEKVLAGETDKWNRLLKVVKAKDNEDDVQEELFKSDVDKPDPEILFIFGPPESLFSGV